MFKYSYNILNYRMQYVIQILIRNVSFSGFHNTTYRGSQALIAHVLTFYMDISVNHLKFPFPLTFPAKSLWVPGLPHPMKMVSSSEQLVK